MTSIFSASASFVSKSCKLYASKSFKRGRWGSVGGPVPGRAYVVVLSVQHD
jgi:hypothetical protein